jgi:hypothetical protein
MAVSRAENRLNSRIYLYIILFLSFRNNTLSITTACCVAVLTIQDFDISSHLLGLVYLGIGIVRACAWNGSSDDVGLGSTFSDEWLLWILQRRYC